MAYESIILHSGICSCHLQLFGGEISATNLEGTCVPPSALRTYSLYFTTIRVHLVNDLFWKGTNPEQRLYLTHVIIYRVFSTGTYILS